MPNIDIEKDYRRLLRMFCAEKAELELIRARLKEAPTDKLVLREAEQRKYTKAAYDRMKKTEGLRNKCFGLEMVLPVLREPEHQAVSAMYGKPRYRYH